MPFTRTILAGTSAMAILLAAGAASAQTQIQWWHAMGGELGEKTAAVAAGFNATQDAYEVVPVYRGNYTETMTAAIAAFRANEQPHIVQVFEVGTATMMAARGAIYPVYELMQEHADGFDQSAYLPSVVGYYADSEGNMLSMPFNSSTPVMYYNKAAFEAAGLDPEMPPKTWNELVEASRKIIESGAATCGFTTGWQSWVQLENFSAYHDVPFATLDNGFDGLETEFAFNSDVHVRHVSNMKDWADEGVFKYGGRRSDSAPLFYSGECAIYMNSSAAQAGVDANTDFEVGVAMLPYYDDVPGAPQNSIIGGATLWVLQGHDAEEYEGVAAFFQYLSQPEVQAQWHQDTGYLPITQAAFELSQEQGFYAENPGTDVSVRQMTLNEPTGNSRGLRLGNFVQIRDVINEELELVWSGQKSPQEALDAAVERGNSLLRQFESDNS
ncbi:sn-glycerol-3-phosphate ABC transporter substrate-binding protein UgpB [Salinarimonas rosea]|uniref:sn-glycerol-3-phosphate ABC transporter substrate-binding protein UgpB n=1 Tax=Salinarimonas rosea TaxID=552063 RepID=UPI000418EE56|nr:sn-glycerol-3-phosphate ABC transporter substrate-binding protein UgpB [Salinarimonas rosea]